MSKDLCRYARHGMDVWREWIITREDKGWPSFSSEVQAQHRAQTATVVDGVARFRGRVELEGKTVPREPPDMPKETRPSAGSKIPDIDLARLGPKVNRQILDLREMDKDTATVLQVQWLFEGRPLVSRLAEAGMEKARYYERLNAGLMWLQGRLTAGVV